VVGALGLAHPASTATAVAAANKVTECRVVKAVSCGRATTRSGTP
jgi:hypothetical protein